MNLHLTFRKSLQLCVSFLLLAACAKDEVDLTGNIHGTVTDAKTGKPLSGAVVDITPDHRSRTTGDDGSFVFDELTANTYTVQAKKDGYKADTRTPRIEAGANITLDFALQPLAPVLSVSPASLDFGTASTTLTFDVKNTGDATLDWNITEDIPWLSCTPTSGSNSNVGQTAVTVMVNRDGLDKGTYRQTIAVASNGGSATLNVSLTVQGATVSYSPEVLDFGSISSALTLVLKNTGSGSINYTISPSDDWILLNRTSGNFSSSENLTVSVNRENLSEGNYQGALRLVVADETFTIPVRMVVVAKAMPTVTLIGVDDVTYNSASFKGSVVSIGSSIVSHYGFVWATTENPDVNSTGKCDFGSTSSAKDLSYKASALTETTTYFVRAYAENSEGIAYSTQQRFTTTATPQRPTVKTGTATRVQAKQAEVSGEIVSVGDESGITQYGHAYAATANPTIDNTHTELGERKATGSYTSTLTGLEPGTTYHMRAYATNSLGTSYGDDVTFQTEPDVVTLTTIAVTNITHNAASTGGSISYLGGNEITERGVCWSKSANPTVADTHLSSSDKSNRFSVRVTGLEERTGYHLRAYVTTANEKTYYGNDVAFSTTHEIKLPAASQTIVQSIGVHEASLRSSVVGDGDGNISDCGFCYGVTPEPTTDGNHISCGVQTASFSAKLTGLSENTTYYVRAYVTNEAGTAYGEEINFATLEVKLPTLSAITLGRVTHKSAAFSAEITSDGNSSITAAGFVYSTAPDPTLSNHRIDCGTDKQIAGQTKALTASTTYYVRAYATNEKGTAYGETISFTTEAEPTGTEVDLDDFGDEKDWN
mgnify:CR=1 FL=1